MCFVVSPFGGSYDDYYAKLYRPAIEAAGLVARRADDLFGPRLIMQDIWDSIESAVVMLADLTSRNANVFYELGLAHARSKPVVLITESLEDVPFDLKPLRIIPYTPRATGWERKLKKEIRESLVSVLNAPDLGVFRPFRAHGAPVAEDRKINAARIDELLRKVASLSKILANNSFGMAPRIERRELRPEEAEAVIVHYVRNGVESKEIRKELLPLVGAAEAWIDSRIGEAQARLDEERRSQ